MDYTNQKAQTKETSLEKEESFETKNIELDSLARIYMKFSIRAELDFCPQDRFEKFEAMTL